jgi:hypothetical protein
MYGFVIEQSRCPRCRNLRTARLRSVSFCFNCRAQFRVRSERSERSRDGSAVLEPSTVSPSTA